MVENKEEEPESQELKIQSWSLIVSFLVINFLKNFFLNLFFSIWTFCKKQLFGTQEKS